jgi:iduronate 2-sulfatase
LGYLRPLCALLLPLLASTADARPNVLFIIVDDLRPDLPVHDQSIVRAPNIGKLARHGVS